MSLTSLTIIQPDVSECNLLAVHSPLVLLFDAVEASDAFPESIPVVISSGATEIGTYNAFPLSMAADHTMRYLLNIDNILRSVMLPFDDFDQAFDTTVKADYLTKPIKISITYDGKSDSIDLVAYCCSRQRGESENVTEVCTNADEVAFAFKGRGFYVDYYMPTNGTLLIDMVEYPVLAGVNRFKTKSDNIGKSEIVFIDKERGCFITQWTIPAGRDRKSVV